MNFIAHQIAETFVDHLVTSDRSLAKERLGYNHSLVMGIVG
jgi:hypothetical protein